MSLLIAAIAAAAVLTLAGILVARARKTGLAGGGPRTAWQKEITLAKGGLKGPVFWDYRNPKARTLIHGMLSRVPGVEMARVEESQDKQRIELSGTVGGVPFRAVVLIGEYAASIADVEIASDGRFDHLTVERDMGKIPKPSAPNDAERDEAKRVFLGKGIFIDGKSDLETEAVTWGRLPKEVRDVLLAEIARLDVRRFYLRDEKISVSVGTLLDDMRDPESVITSCVALLDNIQRNSSPKDVGGNATSVPKTLACRRCRSLFATDDPSQSACPNCGANASG
jgi:hypothetical protein